MPANKISWLMLPTHVRGPDAKDYRLIELVVTGLDWQGDDTRHHKARIVIDCSQLTEIIRLVVSYSSSINCIPPPLLAKFFLILLVIRRQAY